VGWSKDGKPGTHIHVAGAGEMAAYVVNTPDTLEGDFTHAPCNMWGSYSGLPASIRCLESAMRHPMVAYGANDGVVTVMNYKQ
jgi:hypothetical protein